MTETSTYINDKYIANHWMLLALSKGQSSDDVSVVDNTKTQFDQFRDTIRSYSSLDENWDSYGSDRISPYAIQKALDLADILERQNLDILFVSPSPIGGVTIELDNGDKNIEIDLLPAGETEVAYFEGGKLKEDTDKLNMSKLKYWLNS